MSAHEVYRAVELDRQHLGLSMPRIHFRCAWPMRQWSCEGGPCGRKSLNRTKAFQACDGVNKNRSYGQYHAHW
jgi:hypothetical protein